MQPYYVKITGQGKEFFGLVTQDGETVLRIVVVGVNGQQLGGISFIDKEEFLIEPHELVDGFLVPLEPGEPPEVTLQDGRTVQIESMPKMAD